MYLSSVFIYACVFILHNYILYIQYVHICMCMHVHSITYTHVYLTYVYIFAFVLIINFVDNNLAYDGFCKYTQMCILAG